MAYRILEILGYYSVKKKYRDYSLRKRLIHEDTARKQQTMKAIAAISECVLHANNDTSDVIVSLTSYGKRVSETLPYTLYSLLQQTIKPNRIIVWLDNVNWNESNLPEPLYQLRRAGVEFMFCEDIRSYKKLIPTLRLYPDNVIVTVDDDLYYDVRLVEWLLTSYAHSDKHTVFGTNATRVMAAEGHYMPYSQWDPVNMEGSELCLIGCGGILYPPFVFDDEILKEELFMSLAPTADDLWFWAMEKRAGLKVALSSVNGKHLHPAVNRLNVFFPEENPDNLYYVNELMGSKNDEQLCNLVEQYNLRPNE